MPKFFSKQKDQTAYSPLIVESNKENSLSIIPTYCLKSFSPRYSYPDPGTEEGQKILASTIYDNAGGGFHTDYEQGVIPDYLHERNKLPGTEAEECLWVVYVADSPLNEEKLQLQIENFAAQFKHGLGGEHFPGEFTEKVARWDKPRSPETNKLEISELCRSEFFRPEHLTKLFVLSGTVDCLKKVEFDIKNDIFQKAYESSMYAQKRAELNGTPADTSSRCLIL